MAFPSKKVKTRRCKLCIDNVTAVNYKDKKALHDYVNDRGKILPRKATGLCAKHQRMVSKAVKTSRNIALLPYVNEYIR